MAIDLTSLPRPNTGVPGVDDFINTFIRDLIARFGAEQENRLSSQYYDTSVVGTTVNLDPDIFFQIIDPNAGATVAALPDPTLEKCIGKVISVKRTAGVNTVQVTGIEGGAFDPIILADQGDGITVFSNGAFWYIIATNGL